MTPGLAHIFCQHKVCKGFVTMTSAENPEIFTKILTRNLRYLLTGIIGIITQGAVNLIIVIAIIISKM